MNYLYGRWIRWGGLPVGGVLQEDVLSWHVFHVREERINRIIQILTEFLVIHPTLLVHANPTGPLSNLVVAELPTIILQVKAEIVVELLPLC